MKILDIHKHRVGDLGTERWTITAHDADRILDQWFSSTFGNSKQWEKTWYGKQYHNRNKVQYQIKDKQSMTMFLLKWA